MPKPVEEMTREEIAEERAKLARVRQALENGSVSKPNPIADVQALFEARNAMLEQGMELPPYEIAPDDEETNEAPNLSDDEPVEAPWEYETTEYEGFPLEYRRPDESALLAISLSSMPGLGADQQMQIFTAFMGNHLSSKTLTHVLLRLVAPEDSFSMQDLIKVMTAQD